MTLIYFFFAEFFFSLSQRPLFVLFFFYFLFGSNHSATIRALQLIKYLSLISLLPQSDRCKLHEQVHNKSFLPPLAMRMRHEYLAISYLCSTCKQACVMMLYLRPCKGAFLHSDVNVQRNFFTGKCYSLFILSLSWECRADAVTIPFTVSLWFAIIAKAHLDQRTHKAICLETNHFFYFTLSLRNQTNVPTLLTLNELVTVTSILLLPLSPADEKYLKFKHKILSLTQQLFDSRIKSKRGVPVSVFEIVNIPYSLHA